MTELAEEQRKGRKPPSWPFLMACGLEAGIVAAFIANRSIVGLLCCIGYAYFSATWALAFRERD